MNNLMQISLDSRTKKEYAQKYLNYLIEHINKLNVDDISKFINEIEEARDKNQTVFIAGNGGSAATASHMANDIGLDVLKKKNPHKPFRIISLTDNMPIITAIGNDNGYENIFLLQLKMYYKPGDKLIVISASGNSPNLVIAAKWVKEQGGVVLGMLGFDGGVLKALCDIVIHCDTPKGEYGPVEDIHMIMDHLIVSYLLGEK